MKYIENLENTHVFVPTSHLTVISKKRKQPLNDTHFNAIKRFKPMLIDEPNHTNQCDTTAKKPNFNIILEAVLNISPYFPDNENLTPSPCLTYDQETENHNLLIENKFNLNSLDYNLKDLDLSHRATLSYLIERNISNAIVSPFDQYAYSKLTKTSMDANLRKAKSYDNYNSCKLKYLSNLVKQFKLTDKEYLKRNQFLPSAVSSFLAPFLFDIFTVSDLERLGTTTVETILNLRRSFTPRKFLKKDYLMSEISQDILWNCIALYKFKLPSGSNLRMGLFNYYLSYIYMLTHLELVLKSKDYNASLLNEYSKKIADLEKLLPILLNALILNGLFKHSDLHNFKRFIKNNHKTCQANIESAYYKNGIKHLSSVVSTSFPLSLSSLCRIKIRNNLKQYDSMTINQLNLSQHMKETLMFNKELKMTLRFSKCGSNS